ncbi:hypothetical protein NPIL_82571 [Nephila pilipes]|uniref:Uncharacterized protein n=1 Tax=Nephila pilipes TaxID=299642 RepID=A0A8X6PDA4_NEPPI|nr:hypothetical protein NPIL_82571 [Nephila pilipes]
MQHSERKINCSRYEEPLFHLTKDTMSLEHLLPISIEATGTRFRQRTTAREERSDCLPLSSQSVAGGSEMAIAHANGAFLGSEDSCSTAVAALWQWEVTNINNRRHFVTI